MIYLYYLIVTIALAGVDAWRIKRTWGKVHNINHWLSYGLAIVPAIILLILCSGIHVSSVHSWHTFWIFLLHIAVLFLGFAGIRGAAFDISLNLFRREKLPYISSASNSLNEQRLTKVGFWARRIISIVILAAAIIVSKKL